MQKTAHLHALCQDAEYRAGFDEHARMRGAGDLVARVAKPVASVVDKVFGTQLSSCGGCASRQANLNAMFPFGRR